MQVKGTATQLEGVEECALTFQPIQPHPSAQAAFHVTKKTEHVELQPLKQLNLAVVIGQFGDSVPALLA